MLPFFPPPVPHSPACGAWGSVAGGWHGVRGKYPPRTASEVSRDGTTTGIRRGRAPRQREPAGRPTGRGTRCPTALATHAPSAPRWTPRRGSPTERSLIDREEWTPPTARRMAAEATRARAGASTPSAAFAERYLAERDLRPTTVAQLPDRSWRRRILPYFGEMPLRDVTLSEIKAWRASLDPKTESSNAAAYRLLRSDPPGSRGGGADRPRATEDPRRRHGAGEAGRRAGHLRRDRRHHRRDARAI